MSHPGRMLRGWLAAGVLALAGLAVGCSKGSFYVYREAPTGLGRGDAVTIIPAQRSGSEETAALVKKAAACIQDGLEESGWTGRMVPPGEFYQAAFPNLPAGEVPPGDFSWEQFVGDMGFQERIAPLGLRYLILVTADEGRDNRRSRTEFGGKPPAIAFSESWDHYARMTATVLDTTHRRVAGTVAAVATGKSSSGLALLLFIFPIPFGKPSFPVGPACGELGEGVAKFLTGENPPEP